MPINFTINNLILTKNGDSEDLNERDKKIFDPNQFKILGKKKNLSRLKKILRKPQEPLWFEINKKEFGKLTGDIYNNQNNSNFKIIIDNKTYNVKKAKRIWMEVTTRQNTKCEIKKIYNELIQKDIDALEREKSDDIRKYNILNIINNVGSIFTDTYLHYKDVPKVKMFERSITERTKLRRGRFDEIKRKEKNKNNELFIAYFTDYQSRSNMYKKLKKTKGAVNEGRVDSIKKLLSKLKRIIEYTPKDDAAKIEENEKIIEIGEITLEFFQQYLQKQQNSIRRRTKNFNTKPNAY